MGFMQGSAEQLSTLKAPQEAQIEARAAQQRQGRVFWPLSPRAQLILSLALALALRLFLLARANGMMDGDEAVLGIQAERILRGQLPIYFYGQPYMGSWDAYLAAPLIALFGPSAWILHLITTAESLLLVPLSGALATRLYGQQARFPALLLAAFLPLFTLVNEIRALGGYVETLVIGAALMLLTLNIADRWKSQRSTSWLWALVGLLMGLAIWIDPLIADFLAVCLLWIAPVALVRIRQGLREGWVWVRALALRIGVWAMALLIGATPSIIYAFQNQGANYRLIFSDAKPSGLQLDALRYMLETAFPHIIGVGDPWLLSTGIVHLVIRVLSYVVLIITLLAIVYALARIVLRRPARWSTSDSTTLLDWWHTTFAPFALLIVCYVYWRSPVLGNPAHIPATDRYLLPATVPVILMLAGFFAEAPALLQRLAHWLSQRQVRVGSLPMPRTSSLVMGALLSLLLVCYILPYGLSNDIAAMQSPYAGLEFPGKDGALITYLEEQHIHDVWTQHWIGQVIMYLEDEHIVCADYVDFARPTDLLRFADTVPIVAQADRPSFIIMADPARGEPPLAKALDALHVTYTSVHFDVYWVITPRSRTVQPQEVFAALQAGYWG